MKRSIISVAAVILIMCCSGTLIAQDENLDRSARALETSITGLLNGIDRMMTKSAATIGKSGPMSIDTKRILDISRLGRSYVIDTAFIDDKGIIRVIKPDAYKKFEGTDVSSQDAVKEMLKTKEPVLSDLIYSVEGVKAVDFKVPVFSEKKEFLGSLSMLVRVEDMIRFAAVQVEAGRGIKAWVMQKDGLIIYDTDHAQIGLYLFTDPLYRGYPELVELGRKMVKEPSGQGSYSFIITGTQKVVRKEAAWRTINFYGKDWILVAYQEER